MPRIARLVVSGVPHHITQRGNRRQRTFFTECDYSAYKALLACACAASGVKILAHCLMPNHVHLIAVPTSPADLRRAIGEAHVRYTRRINFREGWRGHLWQGRFASFPMDLPHLYACVRYIERNPVRAGLVARPEDWLHSSARPHLTAQDDVLVSVHPLLSAVSDWRAFLADPTSDALRPAFGYHERTGRPMGSHEFIEQLETQTARRLHKLPPGRKPRHAAPQRLGNR
jgi:putative transposase